ncbi:MAG: neutral zinc metallopeptidase, partial [Acidimicrobiales bacterium]|nr:neutral zinc metallopeptidase [Acidimicrobiales bacterium]
MPSGRWDPVVRLRRRPRHAAVVASVAVAASVAAACGVTAGERAVGEAPPPAEEVLGAEAPDATTTEPAPTTAPEAADVEVIGGDGSDVDATAANAVADLEAWWAEQYPDLYGFAYRPLAGGVWAVDEGSDPAEIPCARGAVAELLDNAYYCDVEDAVVWDQQRFLPSIAERYGPFTVAVVIAHEWGHVIQERARYDAPAVIAELQADCFAGAWAGHVAAGESASFAIDADELDRAVAGILSLRDAPGSQAEDPAAHGSGFDRVGAFGEGFDQGPARCAEYASGDPRPYQFPFVREQDRAAGGDLPLTGPGDGDDIVDLTFPSLDRWWTDTYPGLADGEAWEPMEGHVAFRPDNPPRCGDSVVQDFSLFVCVPDRFVGYEATETIPDAYDRNGDFAVA